MSEVGIGCYVYCMMRAGKHTPLDGVAGVDPAGEVRLVTHGDLAAAVSPVPLQEFGSEALTRSLENLAWVERTARAHEAVLARALAADAVVPMRLCTIFADEPRLREMLDREHDFLLGALERLRGKEEWGVKLLADRHALLTAARERGEITAAVGARGAADGPGHAYFAHKKLERSAREEAREIGAELAHETHTALRERTSAATCLPPQHPSLSQRGGTMLLNGAYLVERSRAEAFRSLVQDLRERHRASGLEFELCGPFAPYNFVSSERESP